MEFNKAKFKVLHLGQGNPKHEYRLEENGLRAALKEGPGVVDKKLSMAWKCSFTTQKDKHILACIKCSVAIKSKEVILAPTPSS
ncbi:hypothetical protein TURU_135829 [Turdus rufiventris]|nr:hypothetical protein TURU_135829 [Turdus rufiventris]